MEFTDWLEYEYPEALETDYDYHLARQEYLAIYRPSMFFVGLNPRWQMYKFLPKGLNVMYSAFGFWDRKNREWRSKKFKSSFGLRWLDCGGFTALNHYNDYPFSVVNYANLIVKLRPHYYASMDYPCEPEISRSLGLMSNKERIKATMQNTVELAEWESQLVGQMVPVIQGYTLDEYLYCLDLYNQVGLVRDYMAVGSMCRRISKDQLSELIPGIYYHAKSLGVERLHFFGLKLSSDLESYRDFIYSRDSAAIFFGNRTWNGRRFPRGQKEKEEAFMDFFSKLDEMKFSYICNDINRPKVLYYYL